MKPPALLALERLSRSATDCSLLEPAKASVGGVDPLGLRQINFDLMNDVFPGLNNVARHIRPFTVVAWAWRRTIALARERKLKLPISVHEDFVARVEVAFVWSMLQAYESGDIDIPGKQRIAEQWGEAKSLRFGDDDWKAFVGARRNSTALTAAINYGPGLRAFRLLVDDAHQLGVRVPGEETGQLLDAFEAQIKPMLGHKLFNDWDECSLARGKAQEWAGLWDTDNLLREERRGMRDRLRGKRASTSRRGGFTLLARACADVSADDEDRVRVAMFALDDPDLRDEAVSWRRVQVRQAFRLALESLFEWIIATIDDGLISTEALAQHLIDDFEIKPEPTVRAWFARLASDGASAIDAIDDLQESFALGEGIGAAAVVALAVSLMSDPILYDRSDRRERLPIALAAGDLDRLGDETPQRFLQHVIESWVIAQHTYWSVGRGLADARAGAKRILRLRLVLEPGGWRVTRGRGSRGMPRPTPDRLRTAISLARESKLIKG